ncbi:MAG TPA: tryptophan--tRNA ligase [Patescibacteria group bacterium]|nr:tryptophan--tRNA ligase [Patescibacteria group bacterium]
MKTRVLSGIRATGRLHLGNYLGAVKGMLSLQDNPEQETFYMVADIHTITTPYRVEELRRNRREVVLDYLAAGLDPEKSVIFLQSDVSEHLELAFYLSSVATVAKMQHLPTYKDKVKQYPEHATMALLNYPLLMAADILIYKASLVPVGLDQEPHLEIAREIARRMNKDYGINFPEPKRFATKGEYVPSLAGTGKMSKSVEGSYINLTDSLDDIKKALAHVVTDSGRGTVRKVEGRREYMYENENGKLSDGVAALLKFVELFQGSEKKREYDDQYDNEGIRYGDLKSELAEAIYAELEPIQKRRAELEANPEYVDKVIREGAEKARVVASQTVREVKEKMGLA